jgi:hypothetical protein
MSEVKVNKISPRSGTTVTLGDSGDTFTIPSGATINNQGTATNFGATGSASWTTTVKTGDFTAVAGEGYFVDTTSQEIDVTLPAGSPGAVVAVKDYAKTWDTNNCIIISNGSEKIGGSTNNAVLSTEGLAVTFIYIDSTQGWLVTDDGLQSSASTNPYIEATGGTETTSGNCKIHTFTGPGTFTVSKTAIAAANNELSYMVVAGGGAGGTGYQSGGGGAGGFREYKSPVTPYTASPLDGNPGGTAITVSAQAYPITIGGGGTAPSSNCEAGGNGNSSVFSIITSTAGGGGGAHSNPSGPQNVGRNGGSGGGAGRRCGSHSGGSGNTPPVSPSQGSDGGDTSPPYVIPYNGAGGGGATAQGTNTSGSTVGPGGAGATTTISGSPTAYAGGGGGGGYASPASSSTPSNTGSGGTGGGGNGAVGTVTSAQAGTANTGGGGGGAAHPTASTNIGGSGGSGIVIIRYKFQ